MTARCSRCSGKLWLSLPDGPRFPGEWSCLSCGKVHYETNEDLRARLGGPTPLDVARREFHESTVKKGRPCKEKVQ